MLTAEVSSVSRSSTSVLASAFAALVAARRAAMDVSGDESKPTSAAVNRWRLDSYSAGNERPNAALSDSHLLSRATVMPVVLVSNSSVLLTNSQSFAGCAGDRQRRRTSGCSDRAYSPTQLSTCEAESSHM